jgi:hypothetical protein
MVWFSLTKRPPGTFSFLMIAATNRRFWRRLVVLCRMIASESMIAVLSLAILTRLIRLRVVVRQDGFVWLDVMRPIKRNFVAARFVPLSVPMPFSIPNEITCLYGVSVILESLQAVLKDGVMTLFVGQRPNACRWTFRKI